MPALSTPRMVAGFKVDPVPGMNVPTAANTPFRPARAFGARHTTCSRSAPVSTTQTRSLSAFGCGRVSITSATTKSRKAPPRSITASTSRPIIVSLSAISTRRGVGFQVVLQPGQRELHRGRLRVAPTLTLPLARLLLPLPAFEV